MIAGLCQEAKPEPEWPYRQDWIVEDYVIDSRHPSMLYIRGHNLNFPVGECGFYFSWAIPLDNISWRYDFTHAVERI